MSDTEELERLEQQHKSGALSDEEYAKAVDRRGKLSLQDQLILWAGYPLFRMFFWRTGGVWGLFVLALLLFFTGYQVAPGREWVQLAWPVEIFYMTVGLVGAIAGFIGGQRRIVAGVCGALAGIASLWLIGFAYEHLPQVWPDRIVGVIGLIALVVGLIPGVLAYEVCDRFLPPPADD